MGAFFSSHLKRHPYTRHLSVAMRNFFSWCMHSNITLEQIQQKEKKAHPVFRA